MKATVLVRKVHQSVGEAWGVVKETLEEPCELLINLVMLFECAVDEGEWVGLLGVDTHRGAKNFG